MTPELEFRAAAALLAQTASFGARVPDIAACLSSMHSPGRAALLPDIRRLPGPRGEACPQIAAVDSSHNTLSTAGMDVVLIAGIRKRGPRLDGRVHASGSR